MSTVLRTAARGVSVRLDEAGQGLPVLLVHGQLFSHRAWDGVVDRMRPDGPVARLDLPGHGASAPHAHPDVADLGEAIVEVVDLLGWQQVIAVGHSLGALAALHASLRAPERFAGLVHVGLPPAELSAAAKQQFEDFASAVERGFPPGIECLLAGVWYSEAYQRTHSDVPERIRSVLHTIDPAQAAVSLRSLARMPSVLPLLPKYRTPTLVVSMQADAATPLERSRDLVDALGASVVELPGGHLPMEECPEELTSALRSAISSMANATRRPQG